MEKLDDVTKFVDLANSIKKIESEGETLFYRGVQPYYKGKGTEYHENFNKDVIIPKLYRDSLNEKEIIEAALDKYPNEFSNINSNIEVLLKLQYYEIPTRLLDITSNPFIATYFSLDNVPEKKTSKVYIFNSKDFVLKNTQSHTVEMIVSMSRLEIRLQENIKRNLFLYGALALCFTLDFYNMDNNEENKIDISGVTIRKLEEINNILQGCKYFKRLYKEACADKFECTEYDIMLALGELISKEINSYNMFENILELIQNKSLESYSYMFSNTVIAKFIEKHIKSQEEFQKLIGEIRRTYSYFDDRINLFDFFQDYIVTTKNANDRIKNQNGAFILMSPLRTQLSKNLIDKQFDVKSSSDIMRLLSVLNINREFVYPELNHFNYQKYKTEF
ncbi:FRG domain-containing protein [Streptococcus mutans]|uniref:FRG domain-containing protein n=1 Tax=Streptococcus mutans TaxID=1309 RepID=UPI0022E1E8AC|nr:FRG domain-containing protein [Streptococcus mutans]